MKQLAQANLLARNNLSDQIFHLIGDQIVHNDLIPGELLFETKISKELGVSRSPVRDALHMLEQIWLVERTPKGSYQVTALSLDRIQHLYETAIVIYQFVFSKAAENVTPNDVAELEKLMTNLEASIKGNDFELYITNVTKMAQKILIIAGNPMIKRIAIELMPAAQRVQWASITHLPGQLKTVVTHLRRGYENIIKQKPEEAAKAFKDFCMAHIEVVIDSLNQSRDKNPAKKLGNAS
ncbi:MAG: GntR family transcriptional regulator [Deltaproteobacteria bacterium]|nr:GntR family transcriptional regulator [Deltaproteobacteria bacterium]